MLGGEGSQFYGGGQKRALEGLQGSSKKLDIGNNLFLQWLYLIKAYWNLRHFCPYRSHNQVKSLGKNDLKDFFLIW